MCEVYLNPGGAAADIPAAALLLLAAAEQDAAALHLAARALRRIAQDAIKTK